MEYYFSKTVELPFERAIERVTEELAREGFGVLTRIDMRETLKKKLDVEFRNYVILGACNPPAAYRALQLEDRIGTMLPCNVVVQEREEGSVEVAAVDPVASMAAIDPVASMAAIENDQLGTVAEDIREKLRSVIAAL